MHGNVSDESLILTQIKLKISCEKFVSDESGSIFMENARVLWPEECFLVHKACLVENSVKKDHQTVHFHLSAESWWSMSKLMLSWTASFDFCLTWQILKESMYLLAQVWLSILPHWKELWSARAPGTCAFRKYKGIKILAVMNSGFCMKNDRDYLHPIEKKLGLLVKQTGCCIYEYLCLTTKVPLAEISFYVCGTP